MGERVMALGVAWVILVAHSSPNNLELMSKLEWPHLGPMNVIPMVSLLELQNLKIGLRATLTLATLPPALAHASIVNYNEYINKNNWQPYHLPSPTLVLLTIMNI